MALPFSDLLDSKMFTFVIGERETPIVVHSAAISSLSEPLNCLINGSMKEAQHDVAKFPSLEKEDFVRICEFAYRGDYNAATPVVTQDENVHQQNEDGIYRSVFSSHLSAAMDKSLLCDIERREQDPKHIRNSGLGLLIEQFQNRKYTKGSTATEDIQKQLDSDKNTSSAQDLGSILLSYARIYAFGEQWMVEDLKEVTMKKLHHTLKHFTLNSSCRPAVFALARFAYDNDHLPDQRATRKIDELRELLIEFIVMRMEYFKYSKEHRELMDGKNEYAGDLVEALQRWRFL
jgi:hypothetical protein